jgi:hypothetical protein
MSKPQPKPRRLWKNLAITVCVVATFLLLFVAAFVFNPFEGRLPDVRDVVPRGVNFFVRKQALAGDFDPFPAPRFWADFSTTPGWTELQNGPLLQDLRRRGVERALQQAGEAFDRVRADSSGWFDLLRDAAGTELVVAGYEQDYSQSPPRPLAEPWWCVYTRVTWRVKAALGAVALGIGRSQLQANGIELATEGDLLVVRPAAPAAPLYVKRHLDVLMVANQKLLLEQSQLLIDGNRDEEPRGPMAAYTDGAVTRIRRLADKNAVDEPNVVEFVVEPNAFDGFGRFAAGWPNRENRDSMNERVLASFLNLRGWQQVSGGLMFFDGAIAATGQVGLNSKQHTPFQSSFYQAEVSPRSDWLDPFLSMVPENACAAAALRMPAGEFLHAMFDALDEAEKELVNDGMKRATFRGKPLADVNDLIDQMKVALLGRTGFVFRRNQPDNSRDDNGELMVPVSARSPMPQVAWVFWLRPGSGKVAEDFVTMLREAYATFGFKRVWHLKIPFAGGVLQEPVTEFTNPRIPATGEIAMIVFREFFVVSNSGLLIKDILRTRHRVDDSRSIRDLEEFQVIEEELATELNGLVWVNGRQMMPVLDDYLAFADADSELPDQ